MPHEIPNLAFMSREKEEKRISQLEKRVDELRIKLRQTSDVQSLVVHSMAEHDPEAGGIRLALFERAVRLTVPEFIAYDAQKNEILPAHLQALILYYLDKSDGTPLTGRWISFAELPDGRFYERAFQGYTGDELSKKFNNDLESFKQAAKKSGGEKLLYGDAGFVFTALPRVNLAIVYFLGEGEFPPTCKILFDESISHYLPTDVCAILGSMLTRRLISA